MLFDILSIDYRIKNEIFCLLGDAVPRCDFYSI